MATFTYTKTVSTPWGAVQASTEYTAAANAAMEDTLTLEAGTFAFALPVTTVAAVALANEDGNVDGFGDLVGGVMSFITSSSGYASLGESATTVQDTVKIRVLYDPTP